MQFKESPVSNSSNTQTDMYLDLAALLNDELEGMPLAAPKPGKTSPTPNDMLRFKLDIEMVRNERERNRQCEA